MSTTDPDPTIGPWQRRHVRRDANFTGEQRDSLLIVEALAVAAVDASLLPHSLTEEEKTNALEDIRAVMRTWDRNIATHEVWDGDDWTNVWGSRIPPTEDE